MLETVVRALARSDLFAALSENQRELVAQRAKLFQCAPRETLLTAGAEADSFFLILSGTVDVLNVDGARAGQLGPSDVIGEMSMLLGVPRTASVVAEGPTIVLRFDASVFDAMFERIPGFGMAIGRALARRLEAVTKQIGV